MSRRHALAILLALSACAPVPEPPTPPDTAAVAKTLAALPPMKTFGPAKVSRPARTNADMARDFLDLSFALESGRDLPVLSRFEGPVTIAMAGPVPPTAPRDLAALLARFRAEAGIDIRMAPDAEQPSILVAFLPRATLRASAPDAACFVVPNVTSWADYLAARSTDRISWAQMTRRTHLAAFIPDDIGPQDVRDCLNEEIAQALGPPNDLYRLPDSVFNDDNVSDILTGFDMLMLRVTYAPELHSGMTRAEAAAVVPQLLARFNPQGSGPLSPDPGPTPRAWIRAIETALGPGVSDDARRRAAGRAVTLARAEGWRDNRMAFSLYTAARLDPDIEASVRLLAEAARIYRTLPEAGIHMATIELWMASVALHAGQDDVALSHVDKAIPAAERAQNAAMLAALLLVRSEALGHLGRKAEARAALLDSLGWARYGFATDDLLRSRAVDLARMIHGMQKG